MFHLVLFTIFHFDLEKFISKNCKYIFFYQKFVHLGKKFMQVRAFERFIPLIECQLINLKISLTNPLLIVMLFQQYMENTC